MTFYVFFVYILKYFSDLIFIYYLMYIVMGGLEAVRLFRLFEDQYFQNKDNQIASAAFNLNTSNYTHTSMGSRRSAAGVRKQRQLIIGMSANGDQVTREEAFQSGMNAFVPKPFSLEIVMRVVSEHIHKQMANKPTIEGNEAADYHTVATDR